MNASWQEVWRRGIAPQLSVQALLALKTALANDDPSLMQGCTTQPPPLQCVEDWPCDGACLVAYGPWRGDGLATVAEVEEAFSTVCYFCDVAMDEPAACWWLLNWFDDTPRSDVFRLMLAEVQAELLRRMPLYLRRHSQEPEQVERWLAGREGEVES